MIQGFIFERGELRRARNHNEIAIALKHPEAHVWVDFSAPTEKDYEFMKQNFNFHHLLVADTKKFTGLPKIEDFKDYIFIVFHTLGYEKGNIQLKEIDFFLQEQTLVTVHKDSKSESINRVKDKILKQPEFMKNMSMVLQGILDVIVDNYMPILDKLEGRAEFLEDQIMKEKAGSEAVSELLRMRRKASRLRKSLAPQREIIIRMARNEFKILDNKSIPYYKDIQDHITTVYNNIEQVKETLQSAFEAYMSVSNQKMNQIMYKLTLITSIFIPLTFITGVYGMNFKWMPFLHDLNGFWISVIIMILTGVGFYIYFKKHRLWGADS